MGLQEELPPCAQEEAQAECEEAAVCTPSPKKPKLSPELPPFVSPVKDSIRPAAGSFAQPKVEEGLLKPPTFKPEEKEEKVKVVKKERMESRSNHDDLDLELGSDSEDRHWLKLFGLVSAGCAVTSGSY